MASKDNPPPSGDNATLPKGIPSPSGGRNQGEQRKATVPAVSDPEELIRKLRRQRQLAAGTPPAAKETGGLGSGTKPDSEPKRTPSPWGESKDWGKSTGWEPKREQASVGPVDPETERLQRKEDERLQREKEEWDKATERWAKQVAEEERQRLELAEAERMAQEIVAKQKIEAERLRLQRETEPNPAFHELQKNNEFLSARILEMSTQLAALTTNRPPPSETRSEPGESDPELRTLFKALKGGQNRDPKFRIGNLVAKVPKLEEPRKTETERIVQIGDFVRDLTTYVDATLFVRAEESVEALVRVSKELHAQYVRTPRLKRIGLQETHVHGAVFDLDKDQERYFLQIAGIFKQNMCKRVLDEFRSFEYLKLRGFKLVLALLTCARRVLDVSSQAGLETIENAAKYPKFSTHEDGETWWQTVQAARELGHVSAMHIARGLIRMSEKLEAQHRFNPRVTREITGQITELGLEEIGVTGEAVNAYGRLLIDRMREFPASAKPFQPTWRGHTASFYIGDEPYGGQEEPWDPWAGEPAWPQPTPEWPEQSEDTQPLEDTAFGASKGKGKPKGYPKGLGKGNTPKGPNGSTGGLPTGRKPQDAKNGVASAGTTKGNRLGDHEGKGGCFKCGSLEHWSRECPDDDVRTAQGQCWTCGSTDHQKEKCPRRPGKKTGLKARLAAFLETVSDSEDEGDGQPGNGPAPPPEE